MGRKNEVYSDANERSVGTRIVAGIGAVGVTATILAGCSEGVKGGFSNTNRSDRSSSHIEPGFECAEQDYNMITETYPADGVNGVRETGLEMGLMQQLRLIYPLKMKKGTILSPEQEAGIWRDIDTLEGMMRDDLDPWSDHLSVRFRYIGDLEYTETDENGKQHLTGEFCVDAGEHKKSGTDYNEKILKPR